MHNLAPILVVAIMALAVYKIFELFVRRSERMAMIEKLSSGIDPQNLLNQLKMPIYQGPSYTSWAIRIGLLLVGVGLGVAIAAIVDLLAVAPTGSYDDWAFREFRETISILYPACASIFGGIGLVIAYFIEKKDNKKLRKED